MGIRLVRYGLEKTPSAGTYDHQELLNRDAVDSHPMKAITGLDDALKGLTESIDKTKENIQADLETYVDEAVKNNGGLNFESSKTSTVKLIYDKASKILKGDVLINPSSENAIEVTDDGIFVNKYHKIETENTASVSLEMNEDGDSLKEIFTNENYYMHSSTSWSNTFKMESYNWRYIEDSLEETSSAYLNGFVSSFTYKSYTHRTTVGARGGGGVGGYNGLVVGHVIDSDGKPHTLTAGIEVSTDIYHQGMYFELVYDKGLPDQQIIKKSISVGVGTWTGKQFVIEVKKIENKILCGTSNENNTEINQDSIIEIDLNDYTWGNLFSGYVRYGYCNRSQPYSYFKNVSFKGNGKLKASVNVSKKNGNSLELKDDGLFVNAAATNHNDLSGRSNVDAHPISAITGLQPLCDDMAAAVLRVNEINFAQKTTNKGSVELLSQIESFSALNATTNGNGRTTSIRRSIILKEDISNYDTIDFVLAINDGTNLGLIGDKISISRSKIVFNNTTSINQTDGSFIGLIVTTPTTTSGAHGAFHLAIQGWFKSPTEFYVYQTVNATTNTTYNNINIISIQGVISTIIVDPVQYIDEQSGIQDEPVGIVISHMGTKAPKHYLACDGTVYNITDYPYLAEHFKTDFGSYNCFGGDGITTFAVPNIGAILNIGPTMSSNITPSPYTASASSQYDNSFQAFRAFNGLESDSWASTKNFPAWLQIDLSVIKTVSKFTITSRNTATASTQSPKDFILQGSTDGLTFVNIKSFTETNWTVNETREFKLDQSVNYRYYRLYITSTAGMDVVSISEFSLYNTSYQYIKYEPTFYLNIDMPDSLKDLKEQNDLLRQQIQQLSQIIDNINRVVI